MTRYRRMALVVSLCLLAPTTGLLAAAPQGVQPTEVTLDNGLKLLLVERHEQPTVAACLIFDVGACNDPAGVSGIAHMFEHMMFKGSKTIGATDYEAEAKLMAEQDRLRDKMNVEMNRMRLMKRRGEITDVLDPEQWTSEYREMMKENDRLAAEQRQLVTNNEFSDTYSANGGAGLNAGTSNDLTIYYVELPSNKLELFFWMESDRLANAVMREFYTERNNVREERRLRTESTPTGKFDEAFEALFWQTHPYGVPVIGWASEVESITRDDVKSFFDVYYAPNNATLVAVGDFNTQEFIKMAKKYFERVPRGRKEPPLVVTEEPKPIAEKRLYAEAETNPRVRVRYHAVAMGHADEAALDVLTGILSGRSGRLYKRMVTDADAVSGQPRVSNLARKYAGYVELSAVVKDGHTSEEVEQLLLDEIEKLKDGEITEREIQKVKNQTLASSIRSLRSNQGLMFQLAVFDTWYKWQHINEVTDRTLAVTADDVRRVAKKYFDPKTRTVAIYKTKQGGESSQEDAELTAILAELPPEAAGQIRAMINQLKQVNDVSLLEDRLQKMEPALNSEEVPAEQKPLLEYMVKTVKARIAELKAAQKESE